MSIIVTAAAAPTIPASTPAPVPPSSRRLPMSTRSDVPPAIALPSVGPAIPPQAVVPQATMTLRDLQAIQRAEDAEWATMGVMYRKGHRVTLLTRGGGGGGGSDGQWVASVAYGAVQVRLVVLLGPSH